MAISAFVMSGQECRIALAIQSAFGTANTTMNTYTELDVRGFSFPDFSGILSDTGRRQTGSRVKTITEYFRSNAGSDYTWEVSGVLTLQQAALLVYGVMQDIAAEEDASDYTKVFEWDKDTWGGLAGVVPICYSVAFLSGLDGEHIIQQDAVIKSLTITCDAGANGGRATYKATFFSPHTPTYGATVSPTSWTSPGVTYFTAQTLATKTVATADVICPKYEITWDNGAMRVGYDATGNGQGIHFDNPTVTGSLDVKYDENTKNLIDTWFLSPTGGSAEIAIELSHTTLSYSINAVLTAPPAMSAEERGVYQTLTWEGYDDGTNEAIEVTISDSVNRGWIGA